MKRTLLGPRAVTEGIRAAPSRIAVVYLTAQSGRWPDELAALCQRAHVRLEPKSSEELDAIAKGARHQGVIAIAGEYSYLSLAELLTRIAARPLLVALDQVTDPQNLGAIVRSAVALGADGLVTLRNRAAPVNATVVRVSAGATERARIARVGNLARTLEQLRERELEVVGLAPDGDVALHELEYPKHGRVLVVGAEGHGLRRLTRRCCTTLARIPLAGSLQSLNASAAAAIGIYESVIGRARHATQHHDED